MASTLREELASLKIDRPDPEISRQNGHRKSAEPPRWRWPAAAVVDSLADPAGFLAGAGVLWLPPVRPDPVATRGDRGRWSSG